MTNFDFLENKSTNAAPQRFGVTVSNHSYHPQTVPSRDVLIGASVFFLGSAASALDGRSSEGAVNVKVLQLFWLYCGPVSPVTSNNI